MVKLQSVYSLSIGNGKRVDRRVEREYNTYMLEFENNTDLVLRALSGKTDRYRFGYIIISRIKV